VALFFYRGQIFDNEEAFFKYAKEWPDLPFDLVDFRSEMANRIKEAEINNQIRGGKMTNREAYQILRLSTDWAIEAEKI